MESDYEFHFRRCQEETAAADQTTDAAKAIHLTLAQLHVAAAEKIARSRSALSRSKGGAPADIRSDECA